MERLGPRPYAPPAPASRRRAVSRRGASPYTAPMKAKIYHNPRCSKSRATLALLAERGVETEIVDYLTNPPSRGTLAKLLRKLGQPAITLVRTGDTDFGEYAG